VAHNKSTASSPQILAELANAEQHCAQLSCTDLHPDPSVIIWRSSAPKFNQISQKTWKVGRNFIYDFKLRVIKPIFMKLTLNRQPTEFREHPTKDLVPDTRSQTDSWMTGVLYSVKDTGKGIEKRAWLSEVE